MVVTSSSFAPLPKTFLPQHQAHLLKLVEPMSSPASMVLPLSKPCQMTPFRATGTPSTPRMVPLAVVSPLVASDSVRTPAAASAHDIKVLLRLCTSRIAEAGLYTHSHQARCR